MPATCCGPDSANISVLLTVAKVNRGSSKTQVHWTTPISSASIRKLSGLRGLKRKKVCVRARPNSAMDCVAGPPARPRAAARAVAAPGGTIEREEGAGGGDAGGRLVSARAGPVGARRIVACGRRPYRVLRRRCLQSGGGGGPGALLPDAGLGLEILRGQRAASSATAFPGASPTPRAEVARIARKYRTRFVNDPASTTANPVRLDRGVPAPLSARICGLVLYLKARSAGSST